jgi:hypothetical protein
MPMRTLGVALSVLFTIATVSDCQWSPVDCNNPVPANSLLPNGDFNDQWTSFDDPGVPATVARSAFAPAPWGANLTPDFSTANSISFNGPGTPRTSLPGFAPSPAGGSFMGFRSLPPTNEGIFGFLDVVDPTEEVTIFFHYTEYVQPGRENDPDDDVNIQFRFNVLTTNSAGLGPDNTGVAIADVANLAATGGTQGTWERRSITFVPADIGTTQPGTYSFYLGAQGSARFTWAFVDGLVVNTTAALCPPPLFPPIDS